MQGAEAACLSYRKFFILFFRCLRLLLFILCTITVSVVWTNVVVPLISHQPDPSLTSLIYTITSKMAKIIKQ